MRVLAWFSCGSASAYAAKLAVEKYGKRCEVIYCDTLAHEHPDNRRFMADVERWRKRVFLDELPPNAGRYEAEPDIECGVLCTPNIS